MADLFTRAKELFPDASDEEVTQGIEVIKQQKPGASDDEVLQTAQEIETARQPVAFDDKEQKREMVRESLRQKYGLGDKYSSEAREKLVQENREDASGFNLAAFGAGLGQAIAGGDALDATQSVMQSEARARKNRLDQFDKARQNRLKDFKIEKGMSELQKQEELALQEADPNSEESKLAQRLASQLLPSKDFSGMSAEKINKLLPSIKSLYDIEQSKIKKENEEALSIKEEEEKQKKEVRDFGKKLRDEYNKNPIVQDTQDIQQSFGKIRKAAEDVSAAGDLALIFNFMKMLDPGSTVREGEFANAQNSGGIPDIVRARYNQIISGERLASDVRADFLKQANNIYDSQLQQIEEVNQRYSQLAEQEGIPAKNVITNPYKFGEDASKEDKVKVRAPNGKVKLIPRNMLNAALEKGGELVE